MNSAIDMGFTAQVLIAGARVTNQDILDAELGRARHALAYLKAKIGNDAMRELLADNLAEMTARVRGWLQASDGAWQTGSVELMLPGPNAAAFRARYAEASANQWEQQLRAGHPEHFINHPRPDAIEVVENVGETELPWHILYRSLPEDAAYPSAWDDQYAVRFGAEILNRNALRVGFSMRELGDEGNTMRMKLTSHLPAALSGSERAGAAVASAAGKALKKSTMELGGSDAFIILDDADLEVAVRLAVAGRMQNAGQACAGSKRFIVHDRLADAFTARFRAKLEALQPGDPMDEGTTLAPLSSKQALDLALKQIADAVAGGAEILLGGKRLDRPGFFLAPTLLTGVTPSNPAFRLEFLAPLAMIFRVQSEAEAIALANHSPFGLGGSVITTDAARGRRVADRMDTGMVFVNSTVVSRTSFLLTNSLIPRSDTSRPKPEFFTPPNGSSGTA